MVDLDCGGMETWCWFQSLSMINNSKSFKKPIREKPIQNWWCLKAPGCVFKSHQ
jgi:hypothetical protein